MSAVWVIGSNGLLGSALSRSLQRMGVHLFTPAERFCWSNEAKLTLQLKTAINEFAAVAATTSGWQIYWAAGVGTMSSTAEELKTESRILSRLLSLIESEQGLIIKGGCFTFASSAGAIYAGTTDAIIDENTPVAPTTAYAREKILQESLISAFVLHNPTMTALIARISTLYGPGQAIGKQQGLLALIARRILRNQPIQIYVPFDTIRDYIFADDAATSITATSNTISGKPGVFTKIIASEQPTTIAEIISTYRRIARRTPRIVTSASKLSFLYNRRIQFRSATLLPNENTSKTSLLIGIAQVMAAERTTFTRTKSLMP